LKEKRSTSQSQPAGGLALLRAFGVEEWSDTETSILCRRPASRLCLCQLHHLRAGEHRTLHEAREDLLGETVFLGHVATSILAPAVAATTETGSHRSGHFFKSTFPANTIASTAIIAVAFLTLLAAGLIFLLFYLLYSTPIMTPLTIEILMGLGGLAFVNDPI
jgi:hypothetical protein